MSNKLKITLTGILIVVLFAGLGFYVGNRDRELDKTNTEISDLKKQNEELKKESKSVSTQNKNSTNSSEASINNTALKTYTNTNLPNFSFKYDPSLNLTETLETQFSDVKDQIHKYPQITISSGSNNLKMSMLAPGGLGGAGSTLYTSETFKQLNNKLVRIKNDDNSWEYTTLTDGIVLRSDSDFEKIYAEALDTENINLAANYKNVQKSSVVAIGVGTVGLLKTNTTYSSPFDNTDGYKKELYVNIKTNSISATELEKFDEILMTLNY